SQDDPFEKVWQGGRGKAGYHRDFHRRPSRRTAGGSARGLGEVKQEAGSVRLGRRSEISKRRRGGIVELSRHGGIGSIVDEGDERASASAYGPRGRASPLGFSVQALQPKERAERKPEQSGKVKPKVLKEVFAAGGQVLRTQPVGCALGIRLAGSRTLEELRSGRADGIRREKAGCPERPERGGQSRTPPHQDFPPGPKALERPA